MPTAAKDPEPQQKFPRKFAKPSAPRGRGRGRSGKDQQTPVIRGTGRGHGAAPASAPTIGSKKGSVGPSASAGSSSRSRSAEERRVNLSLDVGSLSPSTSSDHSNSQRRQETMILSPLTQRVTHDSPTSPANRRTPSPERPEMSGVETFEEVTPPRPIFVDLSGRHDNIDTKQRGCTLGTKRPLPKIFAQSVPTPPRPTTDSSSCETPKTERRPNPAMAGTGVYATRVIHSPPRKQTPQHHNSRRLFCDVQSASQDSQDSQATFSASTPTTDCPPPKFQYTRETPVTELRQNVSNDAPEDSQATSSPSTPTTDCPPPKFQLTRDPAVTELRQNVSNDAPEATVMEAEMPAAVVINEVVNDERAEIVEDAVPLEETSQVGGQTPPTTSAAAVRQETTQQTTASSSSVDASGEEIGHKLVEILTFTAETQRLLVASNEEMVKKFEERTDAMSSEFKLYMAVANENQRMLIESHAALIARSVLTPNIDMSVGNVSVTQAQKSPTQPVYESSTDGNLSEEKAVYKTPTKRLTGKRKRSAAENLLESSSDEEGRVTPPKKAKSSTTTKPQLSESTTSPSESEKRTAARRLSPRRKGTPKKIIGSTTSSSNDETSTEPKRPVSPRRTRSTYNK